MKNLLIKKISLANFTTNLRKKLIKKNLLDKIVASWFEKEKQISKKMQKTVQKQCLKMLRIVFLMLRKKDAF